MVTKLIFVLSSVCFVIAATLFWTVDPHQAYAAAVMAVFMFIVAIFLEK